MNNELYSSMVRSNHTPRDWEVLLFDEVQPLLAELDLRFGYHKEMNPLNAASYVCAFARDRTGSYYAWNDGSMHGFASGFYFLQRDIVVSEWFSETVAGWVLRVLLERSMYYYDLGFERAVRRGLEAVAASKVDAVLAEKARDVSRRRRRVEGDEFSLISEDELQDFLSSQTEYADRGEVIWTRT